MKISQGIIAFLMGCFTYSMIEIIYRGETHWTMTLTGGAALCVLYIINSRRRMTLLKSCFTGAAVITAMELLVGIAVNMTMHWNVWDYSAVPMNFKGQICLPFTAAWFMLCIPARWVCSGIKRHFSDSLAVKNSSNITNSIPHN